MIRAILTLVALSGAMSAQTTSKNMFISLPPVNPPITYCSTSGGTVLLATTWIGVAKEDQSLSAKDTLSLGPVNGHIWECSGAIQASVAWTDSKNGDCRGYAKASYNIQAMCNGNSCTPENPPTDYNITWNNSACAN